MAYDFNDPEDRLRCLEALGPTGYNALMAAFHAQNTVEVVNGYPIRAVQTRFGRLYQVVGTDRAFSTLEQARQEAAALPATKRDIT